MNTEAQTPRERKAKKQITHSEYLQLLGLQAVAIRIYKQAEEIHAAAQEITGETFDDKPDLYGHTGDCMAASREVDEMLSLLKIKVLKPK